MKKFGCSRDSLIENYLSGEDISDEDNEEEGGDE